MRILVFDTETTGKHDFRAEVDHEHQPDLVQIACRLCDEDSILSEISLIVDVEKSIEEGAMQTHGISQEVCSNFGIPRRAALSIFHNLLKKCDVLVAHNLNFDVRVMQTAYARENVSWLELQRPEQFCTMLKSTQVCKLPNKRRAGSYKWPSLQEAYKILVNPDGFTGAHDAMVDVRACADVYLALRGQ